MPGRSAGSAAMAQAMISRAAGSTWGGDDGRMGHDRAHGHDRVILREPSPQALAYQGEVQGSAQREHVAGPGRAVAAHQARVEVADIARGTHAGHGDPGCEHVAEAEVGQLGPAGLEQDVARLDVTVGDAGLVQGVRGAGRRRPWPSGPRPG